MPEGGTASGRTGWRRSAENRAEARLEFRETAIKVIMMIQEERQG